MRQHRLHRPGRVDARGASTRLTIEQRALAHKRAHVGDVHPHPHPPVGQSLRRDRVVEVACSRRIDRERGQAAQVAPCHLALRCTRDLLRLPLHHGSELAREPPVQQRRLDHVARNIRPAQHPQDLRCTATPAFGWAGRGDEHELTLSRAALLRRHKPVGGEREAAKRSTPGRVQRARTPWEQRLGDPEASAALQHRDERLPHRRRLTQPRLQVSSARPEAPFRCRSGCLARRFPG